MTYRLQSLIPSSVWPPKTCLASPPPPWPLLIPACLQQRGSWQPYLGSILFWGSTLCSASPLVTLSSGKRSHTRALHRSAAFYMWYSWIQNWTSLLLWDGQTFHPKHRKWIKGEIQAKTQSGREKFFKVLGGKEKYHVPQTMSVSLNIYEKLI